MLEAARVHFATNPFVSQMLNSLPSDTAIVTTAWSFSRTESSALRVDGEAIVRSAAGVTVEEEAIFTEEDMRLMEEEDEQCYKENFALVHQGSINAMRQTIDALRKRSPAETPLGGITPACIAERDWEITYKLPALMLASQLPKLCAGRGVISDVALFDESWQKQIPASNDCYPSLLPAIYRHLLATHEHDAQVLSAALPALVQRVSYLLETGDSVATQAEKQLTQLIQDAVHHIDGHALYETLGEAHAHLPG